MLEGVFGNRYEDIISGELREKNKTILKRVARMKKTR
jgi:hypothetical protein